MQELYVTGGRQRRRILKHEEEWNLYERAIIARIDPETERTEICVDYISPPEVFAADGIPAILFKSGTVIGNRMYVCTSTEVLIFELPEFRRIGYVSVPCFNDLHHVSINGGGNLLVANTGLDMVVEIGPDAKILRLWNVLGENPWKRFSPETDYRRVATTKPHLSHPNFVFTIGSEVWVTRCEQKDAVCLTHPDQRIALSTECVHDGVSYGGKIYFTSVDGKLVIVDQETFRIIQVVDLNVIGNEERALLGWCRGVLVADERRVWVGFTRVRKTKFMEKLNWVKHVFRDVDKPTHIALYDIVGQECLKEIDLEPLGLNIVYSIFPVSG